MSIELDVTGMSSDEATIVAIEQAMPLAQDVESLTHSWDDDIVYYDFGAGRLENKAAAVAEIGSQFGRVTNIRTRFLSLAVKAVGSLGYAFSRQNFIADSVDGGEELNLVFRKTDIYEKKDGDWRVVHQHLSFPTDLAGRTILESEVSAGAINPQPSKEPGVSIEDNKDVVRRYIESFSDMTGEASAALLSESATVQIMSRSSGDTLPQSMTKAQYLDFRRNKRSEFLPNGVRHEVRSMIGEGPWVAAETECFAELPDGRIYNNLFHFLFEVRGGLIEKSREYTDFLYVKQTVLAERA